jgi:O-antigen biosynthesis protein
VGAVGPLSDNIGGDQLVSLYIQESSLHERQDWVTETYTGKYLETKLLIGLCVMFRREVLDKVGLLDEELFLGNDDLEMSWRLQTHSLKLVIAKDVFVHHINHVSFHSLPRAQTDKWLEESGLALQRKLKAYYGEEVPSEAELRGVDVKLGGPRKSETLLEFLRASPIRFFTDKDSTHSYIEHFYSPLFERLPEDLTILESVFLEVAV